MYNNTRPAPPRRSKYFWLPVWIFLTACLGAALVGLGAHIIEEQWSAQESSALAIAAMRSPTEALEAAEQLLLEKRVDFSLYRDLLKVALSQQDPELRNSANQSITRVLSSNLAFADDLKKVLSSMPTQVFIITSDAGTSVGHDIEQKLKRRETVLVTHETRDPRIKEINKTEVFCYDPDGSACKQTAKGLVNLLQEEGFDVIEQPLQAASASAFKNRVEVILADVKKAEPNKPADYQASSSGKKKHPLRRKSRR